jgi:hypothetical protein
LTWGRCCAKLPLTVGADVGGLVRDSAWQLGNARAECKAP